MKAETKQVRLVDPILSELEEEAAITKRLLNIIPEDKLSWRPHPKAMSLGQLAMHIAMTQGRVAEGTLADMVQAPDFQFPPEATSRKQIIEAFDESLTKAKEIVASTDDETATAEWRILNDGETVLSMPRIAFWRTVMLNHVYHHRGQLSTYLRTLDVPLPSIYGASADENPFD